MTAPEIGTLPSEKQREYRTYGSSWEGVPRKFYSPEVELVAQHAGLLPVLQQVRSVDRLIRTADVQAYITAHGITPPVIPDLLPPPTPEEAAAYVDALLAHGLHLIPLKAELKEPLSAGWNEGPSLTRDEAIAHLAAGGNIGWDVGRSRKLVVDCEDARSTQAMIAAGFHPSVATANGQDPTSPKHGGRHFVFDVPEGISDEQLRSKLNVPLAGGKVDVLAAPFVDAGETCEVYGETYTVKRHSRFAVAPGTQLFGARAGRYQMHQEFADGRTNGPAPLWLWGEGEAPASVAELAGALVPTPKKPYVPNPQSDRITQAVDAIGWDEWLAYCGDKLVFFGYDGSCGCGVYSYVYASSPRSLILHDGCEWGYGAHAFSGTLQSHWGREHGSRLQLAAFLAEKSERELAREFGIDLGRNPLAGYTLEDLGAVPVVGETDSAEGTEAITEAQRVAKGTGVWLQAEIARIEEESRCWETVKLLRDVDDAARSHGLLNWGLLGACLPRVAMHIPPHVRLVGSTGQPTGPNGGTAPSIFGLLLGPPEAGKSEVLKVAADLIALPLDAEIAASGTGEGILKTFGSMVTAGGAEASREDEGDDSQAGDDELDRFAARNAAFEWQWNTHSVMVETAEAEAFMVEMQRTGTKAMALYRALWMGETVGTTTSDVRRRTFMEPHTYRFCAAIGAQLDLAALGPLLDGGRLGNPQRFLPLPVGVCAPVGSPRLRVEVPHVAYDEHPVAAQLVEIMEGQRPPVWIQRPPAAAAEMAAARANRAATAYSAFDVERVLSRAERDDPLEDMQGHELLHQFKIAAVLARAEGLIHPTDQHWHAAGAIMQVRAVVLEATVAVLEACAKVERIRTGRDRGEVSGHGRIAEAATQDQYRLEVAERAIAAITAAGEPLSQSGIGGKWRPAARGVLADVLKWAVEQKVLRVSGTNRLGQPLYTLPLAEAGTVPAIGTLGAA